MSSYFPNRWPLSYLNLTKNMKTHIRRQQHKNFKHQDIKQKEPPQKYRLGTISKFGFKMNTRVICAQTVADDMLLMALSKLGLDALMRICFSNGCKWRFLYGPLKHNVVVYIETKNSFQKSKRQWFLGHHPIQESESYTYLGTIFNKFMSLKDNIKDACDKLKGTFVSLVHGGTFKSKGCTRYLA